MKDNILSTNFPILCKKEEGTCQINRAADAWHTFAVSKGFYVYWLSTIGSSTCRYQTKSVKNQNLRLLDFFSSSLRTLTTTQARFPKKRHMFIPTWDVIFLLAPTNHTDHPTLLFCCFGSSPDDGRNEKKGICYSSWWKPALLVELEPHNTKIRTEPHEPKGPPAYRMKFLSRFSFFRSLHHNNCNRVCFSILVLSAVPLYYKRTNSDFSHDNRTLSYISRHKSEL